MDVLGHWGLRERPFETTLDARFFHASASHEEALARLHLIAEDGDMGFGLLTGEVGSGKTFVSTVFAESLPGHRFAPVVLSGSAFGYAGVLDELNCALRCEEPTGRLASGYELLVEFRRLLATRVAPLGLHLVLVLDEAQGLSDHDLVAMRGLLNTATARQGLMTIILVGQPELRRRIRALPTVNTRVGLRYHLLKMDGDEVGRYVLRRLRAAGHKSGRIFDEGALAVLAERSRGVPRDVSRIAKLALFAGAAEGARYIGQGHVESVAQDTVFHAA